MPVRHKRMLQEPLRIVKPLCRKALNVHQVTAVCISSRTSSAGGHAARK